MPKNKEKKGKRENPEEEVYSVERILTR